GHPAILHHLAHQAAQHTHTTSPITQETAEKSLSLLGSYIVDNVGISIEDLKPNTRLYLSAVLACADETGQALREDIRPYLHPDFYIGEAVNELCETGYLRRAQETVQLLPPSSALKERLPPAMPRPDPPKPRPICEVFAALAPAKAILNTQNPAAPNPNFPTQTSALPPPVIQSQTPDYGR
ncbi:MAG: hypothetical protein ACRC0L_08005, partial [Angustibacter sp.]